MLSETDSKPIVILEARAKGNKSTKENKKRTRITKFGINPTRGQTPIGIYALLVTN